MNESNIDQQTSDDTLYRLAELFKVFGDPTRIRILHSLAEDELCVQDKIPSGGQDHLLLPG